MKTIMSTMRKAPIGAALAAALAMGAVAAAGAPAAAATAQERPRALAATCDSIGQAYRSSADQATALMNAGTTAADFTAAAQAYIQAADQATAALNGATGCTNALSQQMTPGIISAANAFGKWVMRLGAPPLPRRRRPGRGRSNRKHARRSGGGLPDSPGADQAQSDAPGHPVGERPVDPHHHRRRPLIHTPRRGPQGQIRRAVTRIAFVTAVVSQSQPGSR